MTEKFKIQRVEDDIEKATQKDEENTVQETGKVDGQKSRRSIKWTVDKVDGP